MKLTTFPTMSDMWNHKKMTPAYMQPNAVPYAVVLEGYLDTDECNALANEFENEEPYNIHGCKATTRECPRPLSAVLDPIMAIGKQMNNQFWEFQLSPECAAWLQTYVEGDSYLTHADQAPGQTRKLTAIALITDPNQYEGGDLVVYGNPPMSMTVPKTQGTIVIIQGWMLHRVEVVKYGIRQTINLGFWGPKFV